MIFREKSLKIEKYRVSESISSNARGKFSHKQTRMFSMMNDPIYDLFKSEKNKV